MKIKLPHIKHQWLLTRIKDYIDTSYGGRLRSAHLYYSCLKCGKLKESIEYGTELNSIGIDIMVDKAFKMGKGKYKVIVPEWYYNEVREEPLKN
jgi:hypothetical protein